MDTSAPSPTPTQFLSPFMPRKKRGGHAGSPPPNRSPAMPVRAPPPVKLRRRRRRLILRNKSPIWNEASQVYQLDFGGRVTQESAKNFQIEYGDKQVNKQKALVLS